MTELPVIESGEIDRQRQILVHCLRVALFLLILLVIRMANLSTGLVDTELPFNPAAREFVMATYGDTAKIGAYDQDLRGNVVSNRQGDRIGCLLQTSPDSDRFIGYSGPTNCLIALDLNNQIRAIRILESGDTVEHVDIVQEDRTFLESFQDLGFDSQLEWSEIDAVSGATLTSYAIIAAIANRLSGQAPMLKFRAKPDINNVSKLISGANSLTSSDRPAVWDVLDSENQKLGFVLSTTPAADMISGYQGPTATLAAFDRQNRCIGLLVDQSYENAPYATYLDDDYSFQALYQGKTLEEIAEMHPRDEGIEGVSGATMTSLAVADGLPLAAATALAPPEVFAGNNRSTRSAFSYWADLVTVLLVTIGVAFSFTHWSRSKMFRVSFQVAVILLLGFINGHMLSQASLVGWSTNSIPWTVAPGIVFLTMAALLVPMVTKHQPYCQHICPFGALQQLARNRVRWKYSIPRRIGLVLDKVPFLLLGLVVIVAVQGWPFNLAAIEPFDGFAWRVAGWATIGVFCGGLLFSLVSPMAYCRFGCPTGAVLNFLKFRGDSHRLGQRDLAAGVLLAIGVLLLWI